ncbi:hypothetical protein D9M71_649710 [compost metagenome]
MLHGDEHQGAGAPVLLLDIEDGRAAGHLSIDPQRADELQAPPGPHAVAIVCRGQKTAPRRMAIATQAGRFDRLLEKRPVPECG